MAYRDHTITQSRIWHDRGRSVIMLSTLTTGLGYGEGANTERKGLNYGWKICG